MNAHDESNWAANVQRLSVSDDVAAAGFNIQGKRPAGAQQGFGRLWQRTYSCDLGDALTPQQVVADWKQRFGQYWPGGATFHEVWNTRESPAVVRSPSGFCLVTMLRILKQVNGRPPSPTRVAG